jgi:cation:H+ antiporter
MASLPTLLVLALVSTAVIWWGSTRLERAAESLSAHYGLPDLVHGAVVVAVGSSFPELSSAVLATLLHGSFDLGVGAIVGSAVFNVLVIPAASALAARERTLDANRDLVYKEAQFYMLSVAVLLITFAFGVIYYPVVDGRLTGTVTRPLAAIPLALYGVYVFIQYQDTSDYVVDRPEDIDVVRAWGLLALSLAIIVVAVEGLVTAAIGFGEAFGTPSFIWGLTVIAAGTSLPDAVVSVRAAKRDRHVTSLANVLGSNVFDLLVAVPAGVLVAGDAVVSFAAAVPMMAFLTFATLALFFTMRTELSVSNREAVGLLTVYAAFVGWLIAETLGVVALLPGAAT